MQSDHWIRGRPARPEGPRHVRKEVNRPSQSGIRSRRTRHESQLRILRRPPECLRRRAVRLLLGRHVRRSADPLHGDGLQRDPLPEHWHTDRRRAHALQVARPRSPDEQNLPISRRTAPSATVSRPPSRGRPGVGAPSRLRRVESGRLHDQVVSLRSARRSAGGCAVVVDRGRMIARHLVEMAADGVEAMVAREPRIAVERLQELEPAAGPCTIAAAMA